MTRPMTLAAWLMVTLACCPAFRAAAAPADEEQKLIDILQSDRPAAEKAHACRNLKRQGTARAVPALAALLTDKDVSHSARWALVTMPCPEAGAALRAAVAKTTGLTKAGILDSIGDRRDAQAVPVLAAALKEPDPQVAASAARALGKIGGAEALRALRAADAEAPAPVRAAVFDALLRSADHLRDAGDAKAASAVYQETCDAKAPEHVRTAAFRGLALAAGDRAPALVTKALMGTDAAARLAALQLVREIEGAAATKQFAGLLANTAPATQVALIAALAQRGDPAAAPAIVLAIGSPAPEVRLAALDALATLGDASVATVLAEVAAGSTGAEQEAARESLVRLRDTGVRDALLGHLPKAEPAVREELVRALGYRRDTGAVPALLKMAAGADDTARMAALRSLAMLADAKAAPDLVGLLASAKTDAQRNAVEQALAAACGRADRPDACAGLVLAAMKGASVPVRCALVRVAGRLGGPEVLQALRDAMADADPAIQDAAVRTMAASGGLETAPDLLKLASQSPSEVHRVLALRGYWRLVGLATDRPLEQRWKMCEVAMAAGRRPEEKKLGLTQLAQVPHPSALALAESLCDEEAVRAEAEAACIRIAAALAASRPAEAKAALRRIAAKAAGDGIRAEAAKALDAMDQYVGYVMAWEVAGPYRRQGKECHQLYDIPFPPEEAGKDVSWKPVPAPADPALAWQADLGNIVGGDHCIVYVRARVRAPRGQKVRLDIGSDDGIKLWVNGQLVHANNAIRGFTPGQDKAEADLKEGWNDFLAKITQHTMGCAVCIRVRGPDGSVIEGLRFGGP